MKKLYDRLYKELTFPPIIIDLLDCPGLLRLRDVRMANNQFVAFPSFASATRYEHSLGVCFLAGKCARSLSLSEKDTIELMIACLYHDVGTPPFAHAMEEVLQQKFGFDHEQHLKDLIIGKSNDLGGNRAQVYLGEGLKIHKVCQNRLGRKLDLDLYKIARIAAGDLSEPLSALLNSNGMDLDNIDNVTRAATAMGIISIDDTLPISLSQAFTIFENRICYNGLYKEEIQLWQTIRDIQYSAIYNSVDDFSYQTMIKAALQILINDKDINLSIDKTAWCLTDSSLTQNYLLKHKNSKKIMKRVLLCNPFACLGIVYVQGDGVSKYLNSNLRTIENIASEYYKNVLNINEETPSYGTNAVVANFFPDKRKRSLHQKAIAYNKQMDIDLHVGASQGALLGLFTPYKGNTGYKTIIDEDSSSHRFKITWTKSYFDEIIRILENSCLRGFSVSIYRGEQFDYIST